MELQGRVIYLERRNIAFIPRFFPSSQLPAFVRAQCPSNDREIRNTGRVTFSLRGRRVKNQYGAKKKRGARGRETRDGESLFHPAAEDACVTQRA